MSRQCVRKITKTLSLGLNRYKRTWCGQSYRY